MRLKINKPSTIYIAFKGQSAPNFFAVLDSKGRVYYFRHLNGRTPRIKFNIPDPGEYHTSIPVELVKMVSIEIPTNLPKLPPPERDRFKEPEIKVDPSLNDIAIHYTNEGLIVCGRKWLEMPYPIRLFILLHEKAHFFYSTEQYCDRMALIDFLRLGYNRSTAFYALEKYLTRTPENEKRIQDLFDFIQLTQKTPL
jgi:hypothetical protein